jgi:signal transduction histidine kinase
MLTVQRRRLARALREGQKPWESVPVEFECARKDGTRFVAACVVTLLTMNGTEHWLAVLNDVTERKQLEREIIEIANREQQRIGSDLHDGLGQELTGIALMLKGVLTQLRKEGSAAHRDVEEVIGLVNNAIDSTRALARGLSPVGSGRGDLGAAIQTLAARVSERSGVRVVSHIDCIEPLPLSETAAAHVYRIVQEALTNAMRHSGAREVSIRLKTSDDELHLKVSDDGRGFEHLPADGPGGMGLKIMRYRAQMLGGDLAIETTASGGTSVSCSCPLSVEP